ncbi:MAG: major capsid protein [Acidobacteriota bacterium]|nr:major capsid protein [Acidobacteriota bacterium]
MPLTFTYPTNVALDQVIQEYVVDTSAFIGLQIMPVEEAMTQKVQWDEMDNERGMTAPHLLGTDPRIDLRPGSKLREYEPIPFKESDLIKEDELLRARQLGTLGGVVNINTIVARLAKARMDKTRIRQEWTVWSALRGVLTINENNVFVSETFPIQQYTPLVLWSDLLNATPIKDANAMKLMYRGTGATIQGAKAYINQTTANWLLENKNEDDLKGFQNSNYLNLSFSLQELNKILSARGLFEFVVYDEGYYDEVGIYRTFIEDGDVHIVGKRPLGQSVGNWISTPTLHRTKNGMPAPGFFEILEVNGMPSGGATTISLADLGAGKNPKFELTGGIYGGPAMRFGRSAIRGNMG